MSKGVKVRSDRLVCNLTLQQIKTYQMQVGLGIHRWRKARGWPTYLFADRAGINRSVLHRIEEGGENPTLNTLIRLAATLRVSLVQLIEGPEEEKR